MNTDKQLNNKTAKFNSIHLQKWPEFDPKLLVQDEVVIVVQVNGKVRDTIMIHNSEFHFNRLAGKTLGKITNRLNRQVFNSFFSRRKRN